MSNTSLQPALDGLAVGLSALCVVHCVFTPLALVLLPSLTALGLGDEAFHRLLLFLVLPSSGLALTLGCRRHKDLAVLAAGASGLGLLVAATLAEDLERGLTVLGSVVLSLGHIRNFLHCRKDRCAH
jgi:hypothetical protein